MTIDGKQWGVPYTYYQWGIYYNKRRLRSRPVSKCLATMV
jgi:multiple sugar transport system substrate-binding protein